MEVVEQQQRVAGSRKARAADTRQRLLDVAARLFWERPYDEVNVAEIAREAGAAHGLLFHHFGSKRGLYLAALEEVATRQKADRDDMFGSVEAEGLRRSLEAFYGTIAANPQLFLRLTTAGVGADREAQEIFERDRWDAVASLSRHLGLDATAPAVRIALRGAIGGVDHAVLTWFTLDRPFPLDVLIDTLIAIIAGGINAISSLDASLDTTQALAMLERDR